MYFWFCSVCFDTKHIFRKCFIYFLVFDTHKSWSNRKHFQLTKNTSFKLSKMVFLLLSHKSFFEIIFLLSVCTLSLSQFILCHCRGSLEVAETRPKSPTITTWGPQSLPKSLRPTLEFAKDCWKSLALFGCHSRRLSGIAEFSYEPNTWKYFHLKLFS